MPPISIHSLETFYFDGNWDSWSKTHLSKCFHLVWAIPYLQPNFCLRLSSTPNSFVPRCLTYQGRFDPEPAWAKSHIFVKLTCAHKTVFSARVRLLEGREYLILFKACQDSIIATGCYRIFSDTVPPCEFALHILKWLCFWSGSHKEGSLGEVDNGQCKLIFMGRRYGVRANTEMSLEKKQCLNRC